MNLHYSKWALGTCKSVILPNLCTQLMNREYKTREEMSSGKATDAFQILTGRPFKKWTLEGGDYEEFSGLPLLPYAGIQTI